METEIFSREIRDEDHWVAFWGNTAQTAVRSACKPLIDLFFDKISARTDCSYEDEEHVQRHAIGFLLVGKTCRYEDCEGSPSGPMYDENRVQVPRKSDESTRKIRGSCVAAGPSSGPNMLGQVVAPKSVRGVGNLEDQPESGYVVVQPGEGRSSAIVGGDEKSGSPHSGRTSPPRRVCAW